MLFVIAISALSAVELCQHQTADCSDAGVCVPTIFNTCVGAGTTGLKYACAGTTVKLEYYSATDCSTDASATCDIAASVATGATLTDCTFLFPYKLGECETLTDFGGIGISTMYKGSCPAAAQLDSPSPPSPPPPLSSPPSPSPPPPSPSPPPPPPSPLPLSPSLSSPPPPPSPPSPSPPPPSPSPSPPSPSPPPSPNPPPTPSPPPSVGTVVLTLTASGSISDFSENDKSSLQQKVANAAGVDKSLVTIRVAAASVRITATIAVPASTTADAVQTSLSSTLGTAATASAALGVTVEEVPTVAIADGGSESEDLLTPPGSDDSQSSCGGGCIAGIVVGCSVPLLVCILWLSGAFGKAGCPSPLKKPTSLPAPNHESTTGKDQGTV